MNDQQYEHSQNLSFTRILNVNQRIKDLALRDKVKKTTSDDLNRYTYREEKRDALGSCRIIRTDDIDNESARITPRLDDCFSFLDFSPK